MSQPPRAKFARLAGAVALGATAAAPVGRPRGRRRPRRPARRHDAGPRRVSNPFNSTLVVDYEAFQLTYDLLTNFDKDAKPGAGLRRHVGAVAGQGDVPHPRRA